MNESYVTAVDINTEPIRHERGVVQYAVEDYVLELCKGKSAPERSLQVRKELYEKFGNVHGEKPDKLSRDVDVWGVPDATRVAAVYQPLLYRLLDDEESRIETLPPGKFREEQGFRLAAVNYIVSISMQPSVDGNHQTNRLVSLSYIREHSPQYAHGYFPIKYSSDSKKHDFANDIPELSTSTLFVDIHSTEPLDISNDEKTWAQIVATTAIKQRNRENELFDVVVSDKQMEEEYTSMYQTMVDALTRAHFPLKSNESSHAHSASGKLAETSIDVLKELNTRYPGFEFRTFTTTPTLKGKREYMLQLLLNTPEGKQALVHYIQTGEEPPWKREDIRTMRIYSLAENFAETGDNYISEFKRVMDEETIEEHQRKQQEAMNVISTSEHILPK